MHIGIFINPNSPCTSRVKNDSTNKVQVSGFVELQNQLSLTTQIARPFPDFGPFL